MSRLGLVRMEIPDKTKSQWRGHSPESANDWSLDFIRILNYVPAYETLLHPSQVLVEGGSSNSRSVCWLPNIWQCVESSAKASNLFSISSKILLVYRMNRRGSNTLQYGTTETVYFRCLVVLYYTSCTTNHDSVPAIGEELATGGQHAATYTSGSQIKRPLWLTLSNIRRLR